MDLLELLPDLWECLLEWWRILLRWCCESQNPDAPGSPPPPARPARPVPLAKVTASDPSAATLSHRAVYPPLPGETHHLEVTGLDVFRYRHHYGTNLGGYFVLEKWLHKSMFIPAAVKASELDAVSAHLIKYGQDLTRQKWEAHWASALSDEELDYLVHTGCTSVRLPIGHFTVGPGFCQGTPFHGDIAEIYQNAWAAVRTLCTRLHNAGIGTLIDLHALPYGANRHSHSGISSGHAGFWDRTEYREIAQRCLQYIFHEIMYGNLPVCIGLQLCNEASPDRGTERGRLWGWCQSMIVALSVIDPEIPIYVSDGMDFERTLQNAAPFAQSRGRRNPVIVDTHKYFSFDTADKVQILAEFAADIPAEANQIRSQREKACENGAVDVIVGEYSCGLGLEESLNHKPNASYETLVKKFGKMQCKNWHSCAAGSYFWTVKTEGKDGGESSFFEMTRKGAIQSPDYMHWQFDVVRVKHAKAEEQRLQRRHRDLGAHITYWEKEIKGPLPNLDLMCYESGWEKGWWDAADFFLARSRGTVPGAQFGADRIGLLALWVARRTWQHHPKSGFLWRWQQAFREGVRTYEDLVGISSSTAREAAQPEPEPEAAEHETAENEAAEHEPTEPESTEHEPIEPEPTEPKPAEPQPARDKAAGPEAAGPEAAGPEAAEPEPAEPKSVEHQAAEEPKPAKPVGAVEPEATAEPEAAEPEAAGPEIAEPESAEHGSVGYDGAEYGTATYDFADFDTPAYEAAKPEIGSSEGYERFSWEQGAESNAFNAE